jgi:saccharopine dehydrogenase-like NADP-dependent oxidoreductase
MQFLLHDCKFKIYRDDLKQVLERSLPAAKDVVITSCSATGWIDGQSVTLTDVRHIYGKPPWTAIQITTAASVCALVDMHRQGMLPEGVFLHQDKIDLNDFLNNYFGRAYKN